MTTMETRGADTSRGSRSRPAISRRACDPCRARKIACDRGSPCANCVTARVSCTHSAIAPSVTPPKQRVLVSAQYEQKIDEIAHGISGLNLLLSKLGPPGVRLHEPHQNGHVEIEIEPETLRACDEAPRWDYSAHVTGFIRNFVSERDFRSIDSEINGLPLALSNLADIIDDPPRYPVAAPRVRTHASTGGDYGRTNVPMPPLEETVSILRWAKEHEMYMRLRWISTILPHDRFAEICRKVYFAVEDYSDADFIIANSYLYYVFCEHYLSSGVPRYKDYCCLLRFNLESALRRLPLFLPASMEVVAALTLGAVNSIDNANATTAWTLITTAWDLCQRLGYHRTKVANGVEDARRYAAQERLFWTVFELEKGLALRLGRSSVIRDNDITLPINPLEPRSIKIARIQGYAFDELLSPRGALRRAEERAYHADMLVTSLRDIIRETRGELSDAIERQKDNDADPMRVFFLQCELVCQSSLSALILKDTGAPTDCLAVACEALDTHHQCMASMKDSNGFKYMMEKYINWVILHNLFIPFSIILNSAIEHHDLNELAWLDKFAESLRSGPSQTDQNLPITHPRRLYELLCLAARLYIYSNGSMSKNTDQILNQSTLTGEALAEFEYPANGGMQTGVVMASDSSVPRETDGPDHWYLADSMF